jgi:hypothetical protein
MTDGERIEGLEARVGDLEQTVGRLETALRLLLMAESENPIQVVTEDAELATTAIGLPPVEGK